MNKRRLTFRRVFDVRFYRNDEPKIAVRFDSVVGDGEEPNQLIIETEEVVYEDMQMRRFVRDREHKYLVGEVANRLYEYEQLGYSPDELKEIIDERKKLKERLNSIYGTDAFNGNVESLYPRVFIENVGRQHGKTLMQAEMFKALVNERVDRRKNILAIKDVIFNDPATIIFWKDGTKTVVKADNEEFDPEKGLAMAISKKALGNQHEYYDVFKKWLKKFKPYNRTMVIKVDHRTAMEEAIKYLNNEKGN